MSSILPLILPLIISTLPALVLTVSKYHNIIVITITYYYTEITVHPQSVNTTLNSTVSFTCEAVVDTIIFQVNDTSAANVDIVNRGFKQQLIYTLNGSEVRRVLIAQALVDNNNTNISCKAVNSGNVVYSDIAVLRIQGELML